MTGYVPNQNDYRIWREQRIKNLAENQDDRPDPWNKLISVVIDVQGNAAAGALEATLESLLNQDWHNLEITVFSGTEIGEVDPERFLKLRGIRFHRDQTISDFFHHGPDKYEIRGDYVVVATAGTIFYTSAFSALNHEIVQSSSCAEPDLVLFDHEFCGEAGDQIAYPAFLPGFDPDFLLAEDYIGRGVLLNTDLFGLMTERPNTLRHLLIAAAKANPRLVWRHVRDVLMSVPGQLPGSESEACPLASPSIGSQKGISVIIPNKNRPELLQQCITPLVTEREIREIIIVDNASDSPKALDLYEFYKREYGTTIISMNQPFNFSRMINLGVEASSSDIVLLLNNDVQLRQPGVLGQAIAAASRPEVGIAGAKLLYPNFTVQHAGVLLDFHPLENNVRAMHVGRGADCSSRGYLGQYAHPRNYQAVTGAFMMLRRRVFDEVGGFDEVALPIEYNDIDFCLRVREAGYRILCLPLEGVFHHESSSRGKSDTPTVIAMRNAAQGLMARRWLERFQNDPYNHSVARLGERAEVQFNFSGNFIG